MSNNTGLKVIENSNEWINLIEEAIEKYFFECYEYEHFSNIQEIGSGGFGKVYRANWQDIPSKYLVLKSFFNLNNTTVKEIVSEVIIMQYLLCFCLYNIHFLILIYDLA